MAVQSIGTAIEVGDVAGDHFLVAAGEMAFGEMNFVGEFDDHAKEIGTGAETFDDAGNFLAAGIGAPEIVGGCGVAGGLRVFDDFYFCGGDFRARSGGFFRANSGMRFFWFSHGMPALVRDEENRCYRAIGICSRPMKNIGLHEPVIPDPPRGMG